MLRVLGVVLLITAVLFAVAVPALAQENQAQAGQPAQGTQAAQDQGQAGAEKVAAPLERLVEKVEALAAPVVALAILFGALALMVSPQKGKAMLAFILLAGLLLLGGWRWVIELIRYALAP